MKPTTHRYIRESIACYVISTILKLTPICLIVFYRLNKNKLRETCTINSNAIKFFQTFRTMEKENKHVLCLQKMVRSVKEKAVQWVAEEQKNVVYFTRCVEKLCTNRL